ncbi:HS3ST3A1 [Symbiodinium natans]|uniref:HS3ST3A1 protein n=1 Tax=Symbiodinium natans TaxID=878477 RepID=A0A812JWP8_9DINO|nr:HS3ST3A1 [Symbiodinium natans]
MDDVAAQRWLAARSVVIVPGAMKAGTCSLRSQLQWLGHGQDFFLPNQELHYFDEDEEFEKGAAYYSSWFCDAAWADWGPKTIGDVTPSYMYLPKAMPRIAELLPHARIVVLLRQELRSKEPSRWDAFRRGFYAKQLHRIRQFFPEEQLLVVVSERFRDNPRRELQRVCKFLGLSEVEDLPEEAFEEQHVRDSYLESPSTELREELRRYYDQDVRELRALLQDDLVEWNDDFQPPNKRPPEPELEGEDCGKMMRCWHKQLTLEIEADENHDRVRDEFKALARRRKPQAVAAATETVGGSSSSTGRRRGAFSSFAGALEEPKSAETFVDAEEEQDSDDFRTAEARANRGDIRDLLRRGQFACARKDAQLAVMTGKLDRPGRIAVEGRNEELPPRRTRPQCVKEEFERQRARWHLPPRGKHVGYMPQAHVLGTGQGNLGAVEDGPAA